MLRHYERIWGGVPRTLRWDKGPIHELPEGFRVLEFDMTHNRRIIIYATSCMSLPEQGGAIEIHLFAPHKSSEHVELLTAIAHYHHTGSRLDIGHTVNFGRPWIPGSDCDHGLISTPYLDGPDLESGDVDGIRVVFGWLIPITKREVEYKKARGLEVLETRFEEADFNYLDPYRSSVV
jgi:hypothetical protein